MYIRGLILRTFAELAVAVPIGDYHEVLAQFDVCFYRSCLKSFEMAAILDISEWNFLKTIFITTLPQCYAARLTLI